jgi:hypothetical protein
VVVVPFALTYLVMALRQPIFLYFPDEPFYGHLAKSVAHGDGLTWRGESIDLRAPLYVFLIAPAWLIGSGVRAYEVAKVETVFFSCLLSVPIWMLARSLLTRPLALLAVALSLAGTWMASAGCLLTESVALPLATASLALTVQALRRPSRRLPWLALGFALVAAAARMQVIVLVPAVFVALLLDVARVAPGERAARWKMHRAPILTLTALLGTGLVAVLMAGRGVTGGYAGILDYRPALAPVARMTGAHALQLATLSGLLPMSLFGVLVLRRAAWRDGEVGPFLAVLLPSIVMLSVQNGFYVIGAEVPAAIGRYMIYAGPLLLVFCLVAFTRDRLLGWRTVVAAAGLSLVYALTPAVAQRFEQRATFGTVERVQDVLPGIPAGGAVTAAAVVLCAIAAGTLLSRRGRDRNVVAAVVGSSLLVLLVLQTVTVWSWQTGFQTEKRAFLPADLAWVDHHAHGPVAVLAVTGNAQEFSALDFFSSRIEQFYRTRPGLPGWPAPGARCAWRIARDGTAVFERACGPPAREFLINDPVAHMTFYREAASATDPHVGRLTLVRGPARLKALVLTPCPRPVLFTQPVTFKAYPADIPRGCSTQLIISTWLPRTATVTATFQGAPFGDHLAALAGRQLTVRAAAATRIPVRVSGGAQRTVIDLDWDASSPAFPYLSSVILDENGRRQSLL